MINKSIPSIAVAVFLLSLTMPGGAMPAPARIWTVQIAFLTERNNVQKMIEQLQRREVKGFWVQKDGNAYAIRIGRHKNKKDAALALGKIRKAYPQAVMKEVAAATGKVGEKNKRANTVNGERKARQNVGVNILEKEAPPAKVEKGPVYAVNTANPAPASISNPLFAAAMKKYEAGDFPAAADLFRQVMRQIPADPVAYERSLRRAADCYLSIGRNGANPFLFSAVEHYKYLFQHYPDPRPGNDFAYFNLARSYEGLKFYYEEADALKKLLSQYPESAHAQEALFRLAEVHLNVKRYEQAAQNYRQYLDKYKQGVHIKTAALHLADVYVRMNDLDNAIKLYENIMAGTNDISDIPKETLYFMADASYRKGRYTEAIRIISAYLSLYPQDEKTGKGLYLLGCCFHGLEQFPTAIKIFNEVVERSAASPEARESILKIANLGVRQPGRRLPAYPAVGVYFEDPLAAYDLLLSQRPEKDLEERIRFAKSEALLKNGRYLDTVANSLMLRDKYPDGKESTAARQQLKIAVTKLVDDFHARGDNVAIASLYCRTFGRIAFAREDSESLLKIVDALHKMSLNDETLRVLNHLKTMSIDAQWQSRIAKIMESMAQAPGSASSGVQSHETGSGQDGRPGVSMEMIKISLAGADEVRRRWLLFEIGRRHAEAKEQAAAEKSFLQIKEGSPDPFWTKLSDYSVQESRWSERYGDLY